jgi:allantoate deiminase
MAWNGKGEPGRVAEAFEIGDFKPGVRAKARCDLMGVAPYSEADGMLVRRFLTPPTTKRSRPWPSGWNRPA